MRKLNNYTKANPEVAGTATSSKLSKKQVKMVNYVAYFGKITKCVSLTTTKVKIQKPKGLEMFLKKKEEMEKQNDGRKLSPAELEELEESVRFETFHEEIGNAQTIFNHILGEVFTGDKFRKIIDECKEEALAISERQEVFDKATEQAGRGN